MLSRTVAFMSLCALVPVHGQSCGDSVAPILVGSEWEQYVRTIQLTGAIAFQPWTVRDLSPSQWRELAPVDTSLPWPSSAARFRRVGCHRRWNTSVLEPSARVTFNSSFPLGFNDGALWEGRGLTVAGDFGASVSAGPVTVTFAPFLFASQNARFATASNGQAGLRQFADWRSPGDIDLPQRFGDTHYLRADLGQSSARVDAGGFAFGVSSANQFFGPAYDHPIILGNNAAGFPHVFIGSSRPVALWRLGTLHGRAFWGKLSESRFSLLADSGYSRLGSGVAAVFQPSGVPGLELGGARFIHVLQRNFELDGGELLRPFGALLTSNSGAERDNQLFSLFARMALPADALEVYGELGREDTNKGLREFLFFPDHDSAYLLGIRKLWKQSRRIVSVRAEVLNSRRTHLALSSSQTPWYVHSAVQQGHTHRGQALGSAAAYGGGASALVVERYDVRGRWRVEWHRLQFAEMLERAPDLSRADVAHVLGASVLRFGRTTDLTIGLAGVYEANRYFGKDVLALRTTLGARGASFRRDR